MTAGQCEVSADWESYREWLLAADGGSLLEAKPIGDGFYAGIKPLLFHWTMIVGQVGDCWGFDDRWCFETREAAETALRAWDGQGAPVGWHRHPATSRRRPGGDPALEYRAP